MQLTVNERIKSLKNNTKKSTEEFAKFIQTPYGTLNGVIGTRKSSPSYAVLFAIIKAYPNLNARWLITGDGEMWGDKNVGSTIHNEKREMEILTGRLAEMEKNYEGLQTTEKELNELKEVLETLAGNITKLIDLG